MKNTIKMLMIIAGLTQGTAVLGADFKIVGGEGNTMFTLETAEVTCDGQKNPEGKTIVSPKQTVNCKIDDLALNNLSTPFGVKIILRDSKNEPAGVFAKLENNKIKFGQPFGGAVGNDGAESINLPSR
ncbi:MAG: hypothetical protein H0X26_00855 [Alphaproteobacteria bacterium]|nr:hypothetical protein [Alphaproteobacteria bacterium]